LPLICRVVAAHLQLIYREFAGQLPQNCCYFAAPLLQIYRVVAALLLISSWKFHCALAVTLYRNVKNFIKTLIER
jgi:hypothetical protein